MSPTRQLGTAARLSLDVSEAAIERALLAWCGTCCPSWQGAVGCCPTWQGAARSCCPNWQGAAGKARRASRVACKRRGTA
jgi:hypothetical protein